MHERWAPQQYPRFSEIDVRYGHPRDMKLDHSGRGETEGERNRHPVLENQPAPILQLSQKLCIDVQHALPGKWQNSLGLPTFLIDGGEVDGLGDIGLGESGGLTGRKDVGAALLLQIDVSQGGDGRAGVFGEVLRILADGAGPAGEPFFGDRALDGAQFVGRSLAGAQEGTLGCIGAALLRSLVILGPAGGAVLVCPGNQVAASSFDSSMVRPSAAWLPGSS
jgi:hypothetical protein